MANILDGVSKVLEGPTLGDYMSGIVDSINREQAQIASFRTPPIENPADRIKHDTTVREIQTLQYTLKYLSRTREKYFNKFDKMLKPKDIYVGIIITIIVTLISIVIPFLIVSFNGFLGNFKIAIFVYMISSFIISIGLLIGYMIYLQAKK